MAAVNPPSLTEDYSLPAEDKTEPAKDVQEVASSVEETASENTPPPAAAAAEEEGSEAPADADEKSEEPATEEAAEEETTEPEKVTKELPEIKLETAPVDSRFPTTNQTRHCYTRYIEYHRCVAAKGEGAQECEKFAKYYRSLCPCEWVERWNEQRENGTFPGPL